MAEITQQQLLDASVDAMTFSSVINGSAAFVPTRFGGQIQSLAAAIAAIGGTAISAHNKSVYDYGAVGDGIHDDTSAIQAAITAGIPSVFIPAGNFLITAPLTVQSNVSITGVGAASRLVIASAFSVFVGTTINNVSIDSISIVGISSSIGSFIACSFVNVSNLRLHNVYVRYGGLLVADTTAGSYAGNIIDSSLSTFNGNRNILVDHCVCDNPITGGYNDGVYLLYTVDWSVTNCIFTGVGNAVEWWGGDSDSRANGSFVAERKNKRGTITNCVARYTFAGFWGSMGEDIVVSGCIVSHCSDVGYDDEGGKNNLFTGCYGEHCGNFIFGGFWLTQNATFNGCAGYQDGTVSSAFFGTRNYTQTQVPTYIVKNCTFVWGGTTGYGVSSTDVGLGQFIYKNNTHYGVVANFSQFNTTSFTVNDNEFYLPAIPSAAAISFGGCNTATSQASRNTINAGGGTASTGISVTQDYFNMRVNTLIFDNVIVGVETSIVVTGASGNSGITMVYYIKRNTTENPTVVHSSGGGAVVVSVDNQDFYTGTTY